MVALLTPIAIQELMAASQPQRWDFDQPIAGMDTVRPVSGSVQLTVEGPLLRVDGQAKTAVRLCCDRCLRTYEQRLALKVCDRIGLGTSSEDLSEALDYDADGISDQLDPAGTFDPERWIFEQLSLQLPLVNRCGRQCPGPASWGTAEAPIDPRWAALKALQP